MLDPKLIEEWLSSALEIDHLNVDGDGHHFEALIISKLFEGKNALARHRLVYQSLGEKLAEIHALSIKAYTPEEYSAASS